MLVNKKIAMIGIVVYLVTLPAYGMKRNFPWPFGKVPIESKRQETPAEPLPTVTTASTYASQAQVPVCGLLDLHRYIVEEEIGQYLSVSGMAHLRQSCRQFRTLWNHDQILRFNKSDLLRFAASKKVSAIDAFLHFIESLKELDDVPASTAIQSF